LKSRLKLEAAFLLVLFLVAFVLKVYLAGRFEGYKIDVMDFKIWSRVMFQVGPLDFYDRVWSDYPPVYMYVLGLVGWFYRTFFSPGFDLNTQIFTVLIKLPAILADLLTALLVYKITARAAGEKAALLVFAFYAFNPAVIYTSSIWGQIDSFYSLFLVYALYFILNRRPTLAGVFLVVAVLTKPQSLVILPFMALAFILCYRPWEILKSLAVSIPVFLVLAVPPYLGNPLRLVENYLGAYGYYAFNSINAFNFWAFLGFWKPDNTVYLLSYRTWGYIFFALVYLFTFYYLLSQPDRNDRDFYLGAAFIFLGFFMVFTRVHERYIFPVLPFLAAVMARDRRLAMVFMVLTFTVLFNLYYVLQFLNRDSFIPDGDPYVLLTSTLNGAAFIYLTNHLAMKIQKPLVQWRGQD